MELTTEHFWATFPGWTIGALTFLICGFVIVYFLGAKGFCTYACPYGAVFTLADRVAPMRIRVTDACQGCGHCTASCTSNVQVKSEVRQFGMVVDDGCMKCLDCVSVCPNDALYYGLGPSRRAAKAAVLEPRLQKPTLTWTEEIVLGLGIQRRLLHLSRSLRCRALSHGPRLERSPRLPGSDGGATGDPDPISHCVDSG